MQDDPGSFWLNDRDKDVRKYDCAGSNIITKERTNTEMFVDLRRAGIDIIPQRFLKKKLMALYKQNNILVTYYH